MHGLVRAQFGTISRAQLLDAGIGPNAITARVRRGDLVRLHRGVYAFGHDRLRPEGHRMAAVLAAGPGAVLADHAAAAAWDLRTDGRSVIDVIVPGARGRRLPGLCVHQRRLEPSDVRLVDGMPVTSATRTVADLAAVLRPRALDNLLARCIAVDLWDQAAAERLLPRGRGQSGTRALRRALGDRVGGEERSRSGMERRALRLIARAALPVPDVNVWLPSLQVEVDLLWSRERLAVELDTRVFHDSATAFEADRRKTFLLEHEGYRVLRVTDTQLREEPEWVLNAIRRRLTEPVRSAPQDGEQIA